MLHEQIKNKIKEAMMAKDSVSLETYRGMLAAFTNKLVATNRKPSEVLTDEEAIGVITGLAKQRKDSIEQFKKGNRDDLVKVEEDQLEILERYLPKLMPKVEIEQFVNAKWKELGADRSNKGAFIAIVMKSLKGRADGRTVKEIIDSLV